MAIEIVLKRHADLQVVSLLGRLDSMGASTLQSSLNELVAAGENRLLIECSELSYVSSVGLGIFVNSAKVLRSKGGDLSFAGLTPHVRSVFDMVGFLSIFEVYASLEEAIERRMAKNSGA